MDREIGLMVPGFLSHASGSVRISNPFREQRVRKNKKLISSVFLFLYRWWCEIDRNQIVKMIENNVYSGSDVDVIVGRLVVE